MKWEPETYHKDPMVNALLNIAAGLNRQAEATQGLLYGLKYSGKEGLSIAEAIGVAAGEMSAAVVQLSEAIEGASAKET